MRRSLSHKFDKISVAFYIDLRSTWNESDHSWQQSSMHPKNNTKW